MGKNNPIRPLRTRTRLSFLKKQGRWFIYKWLKALYFFDEKQDFLELAWGFSKKCVPRAVDRNRLKRWGRENFKEQTGLAGRILVTLRRENKNFYRTLKRRDFDIIFFKAMEKINRSVK